MNIYQIGEVVVHLHDQPDDDYTVEARAGYTEYMYSQETRWANSQYTTKTASVQKKGLLYAECGFTIEEHLSLLQRLVGHPLPIIGYYDPRCRDGVSQCACTSDPGQLIWFETFGTLNKVTKNYRAGSGQVADVTLDIQYRQQWELLNRYTWDWRERPTLISSFEDLPTTADEAKALLHPYPGVEQLYSCGRSRCHEWYRRRWNANPYLKVINNPAYWTYEADQNLNGNYPVQRVALTWQATPYSGSVLFHPYLYSYPHKPVYIFKNLPTTGTITITIQRDNATYGYITTVSTFDLAALNTDLLAASLSAISATTDWLVTGDVFKRPGYLLRTVTTTPVVLDAPRPEGDLQGAWAGFLGVGSNAITIAAPAGVEVALQASPRKL